MSLREKETQEIGDNKERVGETEKEEMGESKERKTMIELRS